MKMAPADHVEHSFSRSFQTYHNCARQQAQVADHLACRLSVHTPNRRFKNGLEIGCGTGHLTRALLRHFSFDTLSLNELVQDARGVADDAGAAFLPGDIREIPWPDHPDLITAASVIQWMENPGDLLRHATEALAPGGWLAVSGFGAKQYQELPQADGSQRAPGLCSPQDLAECSDGLEILECQEDVRQIWFDTPLQVLRHLRQTGVNAGKSRHWTRRDLNQFCDRYDQRYAVQNRVPLTYHPTWIIARKPG
ncbi:methyltransferase domain-containing protein [Halocynthiibacter sp.]|uniref:methyltransferase domain-containing protein n=1 Tax=Halocynthiibacter sp. TaxID=1979210 RepID=UPI003C55ABEF